MLTLPAEIFLMILQYVRENNKPLQEAMAILRLAMTCRGFWNVIELWAEPQARQDLETLSSLCSEDSLSPPSAVSVLCRRLAHICIFCSNRAHSTTGEVFTKLPMCRACEARKVPKISDVNLERLYMVHGESEDLLMTLETRDNFEYRLYRWSDIQPMVANGYLKKIENTFYNRRKRARKPPIPFNPEEYAEFDWHWWFHEERAYSGPLFLDKTVETWIGPLRWSDTLNCWSDAPVDRYSPIVIEVALFNEFHYRFDYSWEPKRIHQERIAEYASVARHWTKRHWPQRPWRLSAISTTPRCSVSNPYAQQVHKDMDQEAYSEHQKQCILRRALIKAYPAILLNPEIWCRCMEASRLDESVSLATSARLNNKSKKRCDLDFELHTSADSVDVRRRRTARNRELEPVIYKRGYERGDIALRKVAIVSIRKHLVEIKLPGPNARVERI